MNKSLLLLSVFALTAGCVSVKTESEVKPIEIKPIHITMDVNLKVDKELDAAFGEEDRKPTQGDFKVIKDLLDRGAAGYTNRALLEARDGATDDDRMLVAEDNLRRQKRYSQIAKDSGVSIETVQKRRAAQMRERIPEGSGVWIQAEDGSWSQR